MKKESPKFFDPYHPGPTSPPSEGEGNLRVSGARLIIESEFGFWE